MSTNNCATRLTERHSASLRALLESAGFAPPSDADAPRRCLTPMRRRLQATARAVLSRNVVRFAIFRDDACRAPNDIEIVAPGEIQMCSQLLTTHLVAGNWRLDSLSLARSFPLSLDHHRGEHRVVLMLEVHGHPRHGDEFRRRGVCRRRLIRRGDVLRLLGRHDPRG